ncbi:MAG: aspartate aminotransferase family protein [Pseudomonadota bacterium]
MSDDKKTEKKKSHLIMPRTPRRDRREGVTVITGGDGAYVFDGQGRQYLDLTAGITRPVHVGYGRAEIAQAVHDQILRLPYFCPMGYSNEPAEELAEVLARLAPEKINNFFFVCDGSEAVEAAVKLVRHYHEFRGDKKRFKIVGRRGAYHGVTSGALRLLGTVLPMKHIMEPLGTGAVFIDSPYCYRCPYELAYPACNLICAKSLARVIEFEGPELVAAFIGEPIQQGFGALAPPAGYWEIIRETCDRHGVALIADEVICGFGRTGKWFGIDHFGVQPDLITMAKGISSGYVPLGGVGAADEIIAPLEIFHHLHTYSNHPVSCAAALANIKIMEDEKLVENSREMGTYFLNGLQALEAHAIVGEARGAGLWTALDLTMDKKTRAPFPLENLARLVKRAKDKGLIIKSMGQALEFAPCLTITAAQLDQGLDLIDRCLAEEEKELGLA